MNRPLLLTALLALGVPFSLAAQEQPVPQDPNEPPAEAKSTLEPTVPEETEPRPTRANPATPAVPATPATPASPATPTTLATPAVRATPAVPATPATPATPTGTLPPRTVTAEAPGASTVTGQTSLTDGAGNQVTVTSSKPTPPPRDHRAEFNALDRDGNGSISRREAAADKYMVRTFRALDSDGDGALNYDEALRWLDD